MRPVSKFVFQIALPLTILAAGSTMANASDMTSAKPVCTCSESVSGSTAAIGRFTAVSGSVVALGNAGASKGAVGSAIAAGTRVSTGPASSASIRVGRSCNLTLPENTDAEIVVNRGVFCARVVAAAPVGGAGGGAGAGGAGAGTGLGGLGGVALPAAAAVFGVGAAAIIATQKDDKGVSN
jgi:hypothetical protein